MVKNISRERITVIFGTTQTDPLYAAQLANMISADRRILVDDFCDRSLPCQDYAHLVEHDAVWHMDKIKKLPELMTSQETCIVFGSFYLIGEIMKVSRYKPFALR